jgi:hypothetical protein
VLRERGREREREREKERERERQRGLCLPFLYGHNWRHITTVFKGIALKIVLGSALMSNLCQHTFLFKNISSASLLLPSFSLSSSKVNLKEGLERGLGVRDTREEEKKRERERMFFIIF